jgi:peptidoglycan/xylan/chitin deacetylase (PgdA/CDA1 family)
MRPLSHADRLKYALKVVAADVMYRLGLLHVWKWVVFRRKAIVLTYHRVLSHEAMAESWSHPAIVVTPETFERHMRVLSKTFKVLPLSEFQARLTTGAGFEAGSCLVTFDDGWSETYDEAWPVLQRHRVPATVFLPVRFIGSDDVFWQERLGELLYMAWQMVQRDPLASARVAEALRGSGLDTVVSFDAATVKQDVLDLVRAKKTHDGWNPDAAIQRLLELTGSTGASPVDRFMTWDQVREMSRDSVTFGSHGETHRMLTTLTESEVDREMVASRRALETRLERPVEAVSYPNGNCSPAIAEAARRAGFAMGFSMNRGPVASGDDRFLVRRVNIFEDVTSSEPMFLARVLGVF